VHLLYISIFVQRKSSLRKSFIGEPAMTIAVGIQWLIMWHLPHGLSSPVSADASNIDESYGMLGKK
jgi:hypothetical protein